jgi:hypothetical protein
MAQALQGVTLIDLVSVTGALGTNVAWGNRSLMDLASVSYNAWTQTNVQSVVSHDGSSSSATVANQVLSTLLRELIRKGIIAGV